MAKDYLGRLRTISYKHWSVASLAIAEGWYFWMLHGNAPLEHATDVLQPSMIAWNIAWGLSLYLIGLAWARRRRPDSIASRLVAEGSDISFGVYLCHALVLFTVLPWIPASRRCPSRR